MERHGAFSFVALLALGALLAAMPATAAAGGSTSESCPNTIATRSPVLRRLLATTLKRAVGANYTLTFTGMPTSVVNRAVTGAPAAFRTDIEADMMALHRARGVTKVSVGTPRSIVGGGGVSVEVRLYCSCGALQPVDTVMTTTQPPVTLLSAVTRSAWGMSAATVKVDMDNTQDKNFCAKGATTKTGVTNLTGAKAVPLGVALPLGILVLALVVGFMWWRKKAARAALPMVTNPSTTGVPASGMAYPNNPPPQEPGTPGSNVHQPLVFASGGPPGYVNSSSSPAPYGCPQAPAYGQAPPAPMGYPGAGPPAMMAPYGGYGQQAPPAYGQQAPPPYGQPPPMAYSSSPVPPPGYPQPAYGGQVPPAPGYAPAPGMQAGAAPAYGAPAPVAAAGAGAPAAAGGIATGPVTFFSG